MEERKEEMIKIKVGEKECYAKLIICSFENCNEPSETRLTQDSKFYCNKHGQEKVGGFIKAVVGLGGFA